MADRAVLRGEVVWEGDQVKRFRAVDLPSEPAARFDALFAERALWLWDDLEPYLLVRGGGVFFWLSTPGFIGIKRRGGAAQTRTNGAAPRRRSHCVHTAMSRSV